MLLDADLLAEDLRARAQDASGRKGWDPTALVASLEEAEQLAAGEEQDEAAALFFALARRSRALGPLAADFIPGAARAQAVSMGYELLIDDLELAMLRAGVLRGELSFDDIRRWFAAERRTLDRRR
ncbi:MAG: hypothetical protein R3B70_16185 [Polyangiaceae bacterium]